MAKAKDINPLKRARLDCGLTQSEVAERAGIDVSSLSRIERGLWRPSVDVARKLHVLLKGKVTMEQCRGAGDDKATLLRLARDARGWSLAKVASDIGIDAASVSRIERALQRPAPEVARKLFDLYDGTVPASHCYDPAFRDG